MLIGWNNASDIVSSGSVCSMGFLTAMFIAMVLWFPCSAPLHEKCRMPQKHPACSVPQCGGNPGQQRGGGDIRENAVVVDHDRRRQHVTQMAPHAELGVVAV